MTNIAGDLAGLDGLELARLPLCLKLLRVRLLAVAFMLRVARSPGVEGRAALGGRRPIPPVLPHSAAAVGWTEEVLSMPR